MLGYISSTRKKSCYACVKSKRRCDLGYPCCKRCFTKGLDCTYRNALIHEAEVVVRQTTPDFIPLTNDIVVEPSDVPQDSSNINPALLQSDSSGSEDGVDPPARIMYSQPRICESILPQIWEPTVLSEGQVVFMVNQLCSFLRSLAYSGSTPYMHDALYQDGQPIAYQDSCSLSALYLMKTNQNAPVIIRSIDSKISSLMSSTNTWTLSEHLAAVQALIIYQIIRLFDSDLRLQSLADKQNSLLELWTASLWKRSFNEPNCFNSTHESWIFYESLRRTVLVSTFLCGAWGCVKNGGLCEVVPILAKLPMTRDMELWRLDSNEWVEKDVLEAKVPLITYGDFALSWTPGMATGQLGDFEKLLLVACRGEQVISILGG
ncbi:hypothetical protein K469DRAFT_731029 [Zopfia rhizophila CBS 207.26]|uniref:Zn(2)-C6 fungal-type domain-containing protein n=1 Tax=Zopfia rhizophila CBS 207.26 TaxID=1314779 RepID=A0A6A6EP77_9PEZI|nr:hypothetical protein K469DRAFT_731029 [Zopfia rhizophila CBS 207.26]